jgi:hypothetical protein
MRIALSSFVVLGVLLLPNFALAKAYTVHKLPKQIGVVCQYNPNAPQVGKGPFGNLRPILTSYEPGNGAAGSGIGPKGCTDPYPDEIKSDGGVVRIVEGLATVNQIEELENVIAYASPEELQQLLPSLRGKNKTDIDLLYRTKILQSLQNLGVNAVKNIIQGGLEAAQSQLLTMGVSKVAEALGVSKWAIKSLEVSLSATGSVPDYMCRKTVYEYLRKKYN